MLRDPRGSIVNARNSSGSFNTINTYDEYGIPGTANAGRFQYTGQVWLSEIGMYYYKARIYSPTLGRFLQTDPIGYEDNVNLYAYVANDPVNGVDPTGLQCSDNDESHGCDSNEFADGQSASSFVSQAAEAANQIDGSDSLGNQALDAGGRVVGLFGVVLGTAGRIEEGSSLVAATAGSVVESAVGDAFVAIPALFAGAAATPETAGLATGPAAAAGGAFGFGVDNYLGVSESAGDAVTYVIDATPGAIREGIDRSQGALSQLRDWIIGHAMGRQLIRIRF